MSFIQYINEGALAIDKEMKSFAEEAFQSVVDILKKHVTYPHAKDKLHHRVIFTKKVNDKDVSIVLSFDDKKTESDLLAETHHGKDILIPVRQQFHKDIQDYFGRYNTSLKSTISKYHDKYIKALHHELVHVFDPKMRGELKDKNTKKIVASNKRIHELESQLKAGKDVSDELEKEYDKYRRFPWEIDAYLSSEATQRMDSYFRKGLTKNMIQKMLSNVEPRNSVEVFYKSQPDIWKRYTKYLYKLLDEHFNKD